MKPYSFNFAFCLPM